MLSYCWQECKLAQTLRKNSLAVFSQIEDTLILISSTFALRHVPLRDSCTRAAKPITTSNVAYFQQPKENTLTCSSSVNKYDHEGAAATTVRMDLTNVIVSQ